jgi:hypothetical protein
LINNSFHVIPAEARTKARSALNAKKAARRVSVANNPVTH